MWCSEKGGTGFAVFGQDRTFPARGKPCPGGRHSRGPRFTIVFESFTFLSG